MRKASLIAVLIVVCHCPPAAAQSQRVGENPTPTPVHIAVAGGLLGQLDGFPELPSQAVDLKIPASAVVPRIVYGGLDGLSADLSAPANRPALLLLGGHNLPHNISTSGDAFVTAFLSTLRTLAAAQPTVVGVSNEDVNRLLSHTAPGDLAKWFAASGVPFVASNLSVRYTGSGVNTVKAGQFELEIAKDASVAWHDVIKIAYPCKHGPAVRAPIRFIKDPKEDDNKPPTPCHGKLTTENEQGLWTPGTRYTIDVTGGKLSFVTDSAVTPNLAAVPIVTPRSTGAASLPPVLSLLDPAQPLVVPGARKWPCMTPAPGTQSKCELTILPPADLTREYIKRAMSGPEQAKFVAVLSTLSDQGTTDLISELPAVRLVVLDPDSSILGPAQIDAIAKLPTGVRNEVLEQPVGKEYRSAALVDGRDPGATALFVRPEWLGETVVDLSISEQIKGTFLQFTPVSFGTRLVSGSTLEWRSASPGRVLYRLPPFPGSARTGDVSLELAAYGGKFDGGAIGNLWFSESEFAAVALHVMRLRADADVAIVPQSVGDPDFLAWLAQAYQPPETAKPRAIDWMSKLMLERVLFQARPYVRVKVKGDDLAETIDKILGDRGEWDTPFCVSGISHVDCDLEKLDPKHLMINGRHIAPEHFYAVAMFRDVADAHELTYAEGSDDIHDLVTEMDRLFATATAGPADGSVQGLLAARNTTDDKADTSLSDRLEAKMRGPQAYVELRPAKIEFGLNNSTFPEDKAASLLSRAVDGGSPKDSRRFELSTGFDVAPLDTLRHAIRFVGTIEYKDERVQDQRTIDKDQFTLGLRYDRKIPIKTKTSRVFAGAFLEGGFRDHQQTVTPTRLLKEVTDPTNPSVQIPSITFSGDDLKYMLEPRRYRSVGAGFELADVTTHPHVKVTAIEIRVDKGRTSNDVAGATLNGDLLDATSLARNGVGKALESYYTDTVRRQPAAADELLPQYASRSQRRLQTTLRTEHPLKKWNGSDIKLNQEFVHRYYHVTDPVAFSFRWSLHEKLALTLPIPWRLNAVVAGEFDMARLEAVDGRFEVTRFTAGFEFPFFAKTSHSGRLAR